MPERKSSDGMFVDLAMPESAPLGVRPQPRRECPAFGSNAQEARFDGWRPRPRKSRPIPGALVRGARQRDLQLTRLRLSAHLLVLCPGVPIKRGHRLGALEENSDRNTQNRAADSTYRLKQARHRWRRPTRNG